MDLHLSAPCNACASFRRQPSIFRRLHSLNYPFISSKCRSKMASAELQTPVSVTGQNGSSYSPSVPSHKVTVRDRQRDAVYEFYVPEDQYILHTAESQDIRLPFACRHGCCTSCAVRVKSGQIRQPEALGISAELKSKGKLRYWLRLFSMEGYLIGALGGIWGQVNRGYALLCVGFPSSDLEVETQDEDEVYWLQFGRYFARGPVERDDIALELAMGDE